MRIFKINVLLSICVVEITWGVSIKVFNIQFSYSNNLKKCFQLNIRQNKI